MISKLHIPSGGGVFPRLGGRQWFLKLPLAEFEKTLQSLFRLFCTLYYSLDWPQTEQIAKETLTKPKHPWMHEILACPKASTTSHQLGVGENLQTIADNGIP